MIDVVTQSTNGVTNDLSEALKKLPLKEKQKILKISLCVVLALVLIVGGYLGYVILSYNRIADNLEIANRIDINCVVLRAVLGLYILASSSSMNTVGS